MKKEKILLKIVEIFVGCLILLLTIISSISAFDCGKLGKSYDLCQEINEQNLSKADKDILISNLLYSRSYQANHSLIYDWNTAIKADKAPENVSTANSGYIKNAWLRIFAVMPSVIEDNGLYTINKGYILTQYNYDVKLPSGRSSGDCRTDYSLVSNKADLRVYADDKLIGNEKLTSFNINKDTTFNSELDIKIKTKIKHYKTKRYCCRYKRVDGRRRCVRYCEKCEYSYSSYKIHSLALEDNKEVKFFYNGLNPGLDIIQKYNDNSKIKPSFSNKTSINVKFANASYKFYQYFYDLTYSYEPYYVLTFRANKINYEKIDRLLVEKTNFIVKDINNCRLKSWDYFNEKNEECKFNDSSINLSIKTDKFSYKPNETINVNISPENVEVNISYADYNFIAKNKAQFTAKNGFNKITARINEIETSRIIYVSDRSKLSLIWNLSVFSFVNYFVYSVFRSYFM